jgi:SagB-type dehydrogenase family enzyme
MGATSLDRALATRRSIRTFSGAPSVAQTSQLLWAAQGVSDETRGLRTAPSAGGLHPLELYLARADGVFRYLPGRHALVKTNGADRRGAIAKASLDQEVVRTAPALVVMVGRPSILRPKYGDRAERFLFLEAGHAAQNFLLEATALELAATPVGAFDDEALRNAIDAGKDVTPLYVLPFGRR